MRPTVPKARACVRVCIRVRARAPFVYRLSFFTRPDYLLRPWLSSMIIAPIDHRHPTPSPLFRVSSFAILISRPPTADTGHTFNCQLSIINHLNRTYHPPQIFLPRYFPRPYFSRHSSFIPLSFLFSFPSPQCVIYRSFQMSGIQFYRVSDVSFNRIDRQNV